MTTTTPEPASYYDGVYSESEAYLAPVASTHAWFPVWDWAAQRVQPEDRVLDVGCGPGHFPELLALRGFSTEQYMGLDFSSVAIGQARLRVPDASFVEGEMPEALYRAIEVWKPTVLVALEVVEHLAAPVEAAVLSTGLRSLISIPKRDCIGHLRFFPSQGRAEMHYGRRVEAVGVYHWAFEIPPKN
jgi:SAM-dependent methyltransferase